MPENSIAAFGAAIEAGAGIECDLRSSADGLPIVFHDADLQRLCGLPVATCSLSSRELRRQRLLGTAETIPPLSDLLQLAGGRVPLLLEIKREPEAARICKAVARSLEAYAGPAAVMSFDPRVARWFSRHAPHVPRGVVIGADERDLHRWVKLRLSRARFAAVQTPLVPTPWAQKLRQRMPLLTWTVRSSMDRKRLADQVDALIWEGDGRP